jgi:hypothetical protein
VISRHHLHLMASDTDATIAFWRDDFGAASRRSTWGATSAIATHGRRTAESRASPLAAQGAHGAVVSVPGRELSAERSTYCVIAQVIAPSRTYTASSSRVWGVHRRLVARTHVRLDDCPIAA